MSGLFLWFDFCSRGYGRFGETQANIEAALSPRWGLFPNHFFYPRLAPRAVFLRRFAAFVPDISSLDGLQFPELNSFRFPRVLASARKKAGLRPADSRGRLSPHVICLRRVSRLLMLFYLPFFAPWFG